MRAKTRFRDLWARYSAWMRDLEPDTKISKKRFALDLDAHWIVGEETDDKAKTAVRVGIKLRDVPEEVGPGEDVTDEELDRIVSESERQAIDAARTAEDLLEAV